MRGTRTNLVITQGASWNKIIKIRDRARSSIDLTDYNARLVARVRKDSTTAQIEFNTVDDATLISIPAPKTNGDIYITLDGTVTAAYDFNKAYYNLEVYDSSDNIYRILRGIITLDKEVTDV